MSETQANLNKLETKDIIITCCDCGRDFTFSRGEQLYFKSKKLSPTKRCPDCRKLRRVSIVPDEGVNDER